MRLTPEDLERLIKLLGDELELYEQIRSLTLKQSKLLSGDDINAFNNSLDIRETLIEKIKGLHRESDPLMQSYVSYSTGSNDSNIKIEDLKNQIREVIGICAGFNDENITAIKSMTEEHVKKIDKQSAKRKGIGGYAQAVPNTPEVFDRKS